MLRARQMIEHRQYQIDCQDDAKSLKLCNKCGAKFEKKNL